MEGEKKSLEEKVESLESIVRMLELKSKNAADHGKALHLMSGDIYYLFCSSPTFHKSSLC